MLTTFVAETEIPALLSEGALETVDGKLGSSRKSSHLVNLGAAGPLRANAAGRYVANSAEFEGGSTSGAAPSAPLTTARSTLGRLPACSETTARSSMCSVFVDLATSSMKSGDDDASYEH